MSQVNAIIKQWIIKENIGQIIDCNVNCGPNKYLK